MYADSNKLRLVVIGGLPPPMGGTTVSLEGLVKFLRDLGHEIRVVDCSVQGGSLKRAISFLRGIVLAARFSLGADVVTCHMSDRGAIAAAPIFALLARLQRKAFIYRQFGGGFHRTFDSLSSRHKWLLRNTILKANKVLLQTFQQIDYFRDLCDRPPLWFPTARKDGGKRHVVSFTPGSGRRLRCVYVGQLRISKGVRDAIAAVLSVDCSELHLYGQNDELLESELTQPRIFYHGLVANDQIQTKLAAADVLLFPSFHEGEGYSGTLVEAAFVGLPAIVTRWQALPEMFPNSELMFVRPQSPDEIADTLKSIVSGQVSLRVLSEKMRKRSSAFDEKIVFGEFERLCYELRANLR